MGPTEGMEKPGKVFSFEPNLVGPMVKINWSNISMPSKESVANKLNSFEKGAGKLSKALGGGLKKAGGHAVLFGGTMIGSKLGGDSAVRKGAKWVGKNRETEKGVASHRRSQIGKGIKMRWGKLVGGLGKALYEKANAASMSSKVKLGSKAFEVLSSIEGFGRRLNAKGATIADNARMDQEISRELRNKKIDDS